MNILLTLKRLSLSLVGLGVVVYLVLLAINWRDRPPSPLVREFTASVENRNPVPDAENAYLFMLGFSGPPETDPATLGVARRDRFAAALEAGALDALADPLSDDHDYQADRSPEVAELARKCAESEAGCFDALAANAPAMIGWLASEAWLLDRYADLIAHTAFREAVPFDIQAPVPPYSAILDGQRLLAIESWAAARDGETERAVAALDDDLRFWRRVLTNADSLIAKMIATAAVARHFKYGNSVLRELQAAGRDGTIPASWLEEIDADERSIRRTLIGEWHFMDKAMKTMNPEPGTSPAERDVWEWIKWRLSQPLYQPQDYSNRYAALLAQYIGLFDTPYRNVPMALEEAESLAGDAPKPFSRAYNVIGDILFSIAQPDFGDYSVRVADLEGIRRAALVVSLLRADRLTPDEAGRRLLDHELTDPYFDEPFLWLTPSNEVVFKGLASGDPGTHRFRY